MRRPALYSTSRPGRPAAEPAEAQAAPTEGAQAAPVEAQPAPRRRRFLPNPSSPALLWSAILVLAIALATSLSLRPQQRRLTQEDINAAVLKTMETKVMPS